MLLFMYSFETYKSFFFWLMKNVVFRSLSPSSKQENNFQNDILTEFF